MKRPVSILTALLLTAQLALPISATQTITYDSTQNEESSSYQTVGVSAEAAEIYAVTLPKEVTLEVSKEKANFEYEVTVTGEVASNHYVRVIPMDDAKISDEEEIRVFDLAVTQDKKRWEYTELDGSVKASGEYMVVETVDGVETPVILEPGKYYGKVKYYITCDDAGLWEPATCTSPATCSGYDTNDNGVLDWGEDVNHNYTLDAGEDLDGDTVLDTEYLAVPVTKGVALGHNFADGDTAFPATCTRCKQLVYAIRTPEQFTAFRDDVNSGKSYSGALVVLNNDIDMTGTPWTNGIRNFCGTFDGLGHKISNLELTMGNSSDTLFGPTVVCNGLFYNSSSITVQNLILEYPQVIITTSVTGSNVEVCAGLLASITSGTFKNCHIRGGSVQTSTSINRHHNIGGLVSARTSAQLYNCSVADTMIVTSVGSSSDVYVAGLGMSMGDISVENCMSSATIILNKGTLKGRHPLVMANGDYTATNSVWDTSKATASGASSIVTTNCLEGDTATVQSQAAIDILNTGYATPVWKRDLEGINNGYPITK